MKEERKCETDTGIEKEKAIVVEIPRKNEYKNKRKRFENRKQFLSSKI